MNLKNLIDYCELNNLPSPFAGASVPAPLDLNTTLSAIVVRCGLLTPIYGEPDTFRDLVTHWFNTKQWTFEHIIKIIQAEYDPSENVFEYRKDTTNYGHTNTKTGGYKDIEGGKDTKALSGTDGIAEGGTEGIAEGGTEGIAEGGTEGVAEGGTEGVAEGGTETRNISNGGSDTTTNTISAFNSSAYQPDNESKTTYGKTTDDDVTFGKTVDTTFGKTVDTTFGKTVDTTFGKTVDTTFGKTIDTTYGKKEDTTYGHNSERVYNSEKDTEGGKDELIMTRHGNVGTISVDKLFLEELDLLKRFDAYSYIAELFERDNMIMVY